LQAITRKYPQWNTTNTMIIDHKPLRVGCNPHRNVIVVKPFYSADLTKVGDDELYLKTSLWPQLIGLFGSANMADFEAQFPQMRLPAPDRLEETRDDKDLSADLQCRQGEGTCGPLGPSGVMSPHLGLNLLSNFLLCVMSVDTGAEVETDRGVQEISRIGR
jgi:hypothetical protein